LLRATCDEYILVADGKAQAFDSDLEGYSQWLNEQRLKEKQASAVMAEVKITNNNRATNKAERQARIAERRPLLKEVDQIERSMAQWQIEKTALDDRLNDTTLYTAADKTELQNLLKQQAELANKLEGAEERWLILQEQLEAIPAID